MCCSATLTVSIKSSIMLPLYIVHLRQKTFPGQHRNGGIKAVEFSPYFVREDDATPEPLSLALTPLGMSELNCQIPRSRSGFRQRAQTPAYASTFTAALRFDLQARGLR